MLTERQFRRQAIPYPLEGVIFTINIAVCEDNTEDMLRLRSAISETNIPCSVSEYRNAEGLLWDIETDRKRFDIFMLDIYLPEANGVEAAQRIRAQNSTAPIIFISTSEEFYREAFDVYAFNYLIKPIDPELLADVLDRAVQNLDKSRDEAIEITFRGKVTSLNYSEIAFISSFNHSVCFHMQDGGEYTSYGKLDETAAHIRSELFVRCHKSFVVNLANVRELNTDGFITNDGSYVPISRTYSASAKESYRKRLFGIFQDN